MKMMHNLILILTELTVENKQINILLLLVQGVPQLSIHFVLVVFSASRVRT